MLCSYCSAEHSYNQITHRGSGAFTSIAHNPQNRSTQLEMLKKRSAHDSWLCGTNSCSPGILELGNVHTNGILFSIFWPCVSLSFCAESTGFEAL